MDLEVVSFPVLVIADDGWVQYVDIRDHICEWNLIAIRKYNKRRVVLYDDHDCAWQVQSIVPLKQLSFLKRLAYTLRNARLPVQIQVRPITEAPIQSVQEILRAAIDADDDILTQDTEADVLKEAVQKAVSFKALVAVLRKKRAIRGDG
jgi:hypothetical protein